MGMEDFLAALQGLSAANCPNFGQEASRKLDLPIPVSMEAEIRSPLAPGQRSRRRGVHRHCGEPVEP